MPARLPVFLALLIAPLLAACQPATQPAATPGAPTPASKATTGISASPSPAIQASPSPAAAPKPSDASLKITSPATGESISAGPVTVSVDYTGPALVPAAEAKKLDDYHLHYFLDESATPYIGTTTPIPAGNPKIIHSGAKEVTFQDVPAGDHTVTVVLTGNNHVSVSPPVTDTMTFKVQ
jgi:hypothetical protein